MKIAAIIQGPCINNIYYLDKNIESLKTSINTGDIYVSTWKEDLMSKKDTKIRQKLIDIQNKHKGINIILNDDPVTNDEVKILNGNNFIRQCCSSYYGINYALKLKDYDYFIKMRTDSVCKGYENLLNQIYTNKEDKIFTSSLFYRSDIPYHPGDHILASKTDNIYNLFRLQFNKANKCRKSILNGISTALDDRYSVALYNQNCKIVKSLIQQNAINTPPEIKLCVDYLINKIGRKVYKKESHILMKKYFSPIDMLNFDDFYTRSNKLDCYFHKKEINDIFQGDIYEYSKALMKRKCKCQQYLCKHRARWAVVGLIIKNIVKTNEDIKSLEHKDDFEIYLSFIKCYTLLEETKYLARLGV
jgi:hypothetical protein